VSWSWSRWSSAEADALLRRNLGQAVVVASEGRQGFLEQRTAPKLAAQLLGLGQEHTTLRS
jgi:hypothetical protein